MKFMIIFKNRDNFWIVVIETVLNEDSICYRGVSGFLTLGGQKFEFSQVFFIDFLINSPIPLIN